MWRPDRRMVGAGVELAVLFNVEVGGTVLPVLWSIIGAALFVAVISFISRSRIRA